MENCKKEKVLMYLAGSMNENEKQKFINALNSDPELADIFEKEKTKFDSIGIKPEVSEEYFTNLLPRVRERIDKKQNKKWYFANSVKLAFTFIVLIAVGINFIEFSGNSLQNDFSIFADSSDYDLLIEADDYYLTEIIEEDFVSELSFFELVDENSSALVNETGNSGLTDIIDRDNYINELNDFSVSKEEIEQILKEIDPEEML